MQDPSLRRKLAWLIGFRAVISTSFADIVKQNSLKNALLPVVVTPEVHAALFAALTADPKATVHIDLATQTLTLPGGRTVEFPVDPFAKRCLLDGVDELGFILQQIGRAHV